MSDYLSEGWSLVDHLAEVDPDLLAIARTDDDQGWRLTPAGAEARRILTADDPLLFAWIYLPHTLRGEETGDQISFSEFHLACFRDARSWLIPTTRPAECRHCYVAPRGAGKSTLWFKDIPLWCAAHLVTDFIAAFADTGGQAEQHLQSFKQEIDQNELLRYDYPGLAEPAKRPGGTQLQDNRGMMILGNGFIFGAKGITSSSLGMKVGDRRPRVLLFDDIEPPESEYSADQKDKRQSNILNAAFPLNIYARVVMVGTTTMRGSIMHDIVRQITDPENAPKWVAAAKLHVRYFPAIVQQDDGSEASLWPEKWPLWYLQELRVDNPDDYQRNYLNLPPDGEGEYWTVNDIRYGDLPGITRRLLSIDPAAKSKKTSDPTGLAVVAYSPSEVACLVEFAEQVRLTPAKLRDKVIRVIQEFGITHVLIETNQGGEWLEEVLAPLPVQKILTVHQADKKEHRAAKVLDHYQSGRVLHKRKFVALEDQQLAFPKVAHDDLVDAAGSGVHLFLKDIKNPPRRPTSRAYA